MGAIGRHSHCCCAAATRHTTGATRLAAALRRASAPHASEAGGWSHRRASRGDSRAARSSCRSGSSRIQASADKTHPRSADETRETLLRDSDCSLSHCCRSSKAQRFEGGAGRGEGRGAREGGITCGHGVHPHGVLGLFLAAHEFGAFGSSCGPCDAPPGHSNLAHQLIESTQADMLIWGPG